MVRLTSASHVSRESKGFCANQGVVQVGWLGAKGDGSYSKVGCDIYERRMRVEVQALRTFGKISEKELEAISSVV